MYLTKVNPQFVSRDEFLTPFDQIFDKFFSDSMPVLNDTFGVDFFRKGSFPKVNVTEYKDKVVIQANVAGLSKDDVKIEIENDTLTISGNKQKSNDADDGICVRRELKMSGFQRSFALGSNVDQTKIDAKFENGILNITLVKKVEDPPKPTVKRVEIK